MQSPVTRRFSLVVVALAAMAACRADTSGLTTLEVDELALRMASERPPLVCDANSAKTRSREGVIPGAVLLSSYRDYDPLAELGADLGRELVFYCHSVRCGAAVDAARKAVAAGYRRVAVLPGGITGWARAGQPVAQPAQGDAS